MPKKTCPKCNKEHGTRKKVCECGHSFSANGHPLYPEPGAWVLDTDRDMPKIMRPDPISPTKKIGVKELREQYVAYEGLGFCLYNYIQPHHITDKKLRVLWIKARKAMQDIVHYLETVDRPPLT